MSEDGPARLRVMADYFAEPVWGRHPSGRPVALGSLGLPEDLKERLRCWAGRYDALEDTGYAWPSATEQEAFNEEGRALAREVQGVLGPAWDVEYQAG